MMESVDGNANKTLNPEAMKAIDSNKAQAVSLDVLELSYNPGRHYLRELEEFVQQSTPSFLASTTPREKDFGEAAYLAKVSFRAEQGQVTAIMSPDQAERRTLVDLLGERRKYGMFDGNILINGVRNGSTYGDNVAFVPRESLYVPGLTYYEMLLYAARLRCSGDDSANASSEAESMYRMETRVNNLLEVFGLTKIKYRLIEERPQLRGELGGDLRKLSIAMEIIAQPAVMILDDPLFGLDPGVSVELFGRLKKLAARGHVVVISLVKPMPQVFAELDALVLLSYGYSVYAGPVKYIESFFCSAAIGYKRKRNSDMVDFLIDIALGTERPTTSRDAFSPPLLQDLAEKSSMFSRPCYGDTYVVASGDNTLSCWGYGSANGYSIMENIQHGFTIGIRSLHIKFHEFEIIKKSIGASVALALYVGLLMRNNGDLGQYALSFFGIPYAECSNIAGAIFFSCSVMFIQQVLNVHIICQKIELFRYEQASGAAPVVSFALATFLTELPFTFFYAMLYSNIMYFLVNMNMGYENWYFFQEVMLMVSAIAFTTAILFSSIFRSREIMVRDAFLLVVFTMLMFSGFPFQIAGLNNHFEKMSQINPMRWAFESLMVWKFAPMVDGDEFLTPYGFGAYDKSHAFNILSHFLMVSGAVFFISILPAANFLRRKPSHEQSHDREVSRASSSDSIGDYIDKFDGNVQLPSKITMAIRPIIFARESSITAKSQLSISVSQTGETNNAHGPTVTLEEVSYRIKDILAPAGFRTVLHKVSGQFDWGKLSMVLGSTGSGKSTLLHVMANDVGYSAMTGSILHNREVVDSKLLPWQRCAFVEAHDEHLRDLSVLDIVTYAMKLRCLNRKGLSVVEENVTRTLDILKLTDVKNQKSKVLSAGDRRRLSIAEEIVHGPSLLIIDEPTTNLDIRDVSTMLLTFREMVNQDKTVIASMHQPSKEAFGVFDTVMILAKGRCIYHGSVEKAQSYFVECPYGLSFKGYENPAEYLLDISAGLIKDAGGNPVTAMDLSVHFDRSELCTYRPRVHSAAIEVDSFNSDNSAPVKPGAALHTPLLNPEDSEKDLHRGMEAGRHSSSFSMGVDAVREVETRRRSLCGELVAAFRDYTDGCINLDVETYLWKMWVLLERSTMNLIKREKMILSSCLLFIIMATVLGFALGNTSRYYATSTISIMGQSKTLFKSTYLYNTTAFFAISLLIMVFANVQFIFYWMKSNEVFLKEHSRGLYSNVQQWITASPALYLLRLVTICMYAGICYNMLVLRASPGKFKLESVFGWFGLVWLFVLIFISYLSLFLLLFFRNYGLLLPVCNSLCGSWYHAL